MSQIYNRLLNFYPGILRQN